jgi:TRAP transporter TAXI family solute receptor
VSVTRAIAAALCGAALFAAAASAAESVPPKTKDAGDSVVIRAGRADSPTHAFARQFAEAVVLAANGALTLAVEESQGSVQNVMDAATGDGRIVFTAPPRVVMQAKRGDKPFQRNPRYSEIRALFPIPSLTMHWVVRQDSGIRSLGDLAGQSFVPGRKGSFSERLTATALQVLGIESQVQLIDIDASAAPAAVLSGQVSGLALAGAYPLPTVLDLARATQVRLLSLSRDELQKVIAADDGTVAQLVPRGTYAGVEEDVTTVAVPTAAFTTSRMSDAMAYAITKAFWAEKASLDAKSPPWRGVAATDVLTLGVKLHPGARRYYVEAGVPLHAALR